MLFGFDLNRLFTFPLEDKEARQYFLTGCLVCLAGFVIPLLPWLVVMGYSAILARQVLRGERPHLVPWDNWEALLKDGARLFGVRFIYASPLLLLLMPLFLTFFSFPFVQILLQHSDREAAGIASLVFVLVISVIFLLMIPLSIAIGLVVPAAEIHMIAQDDFAAGFQVKKWWPIFKKNWAGFLVALGILYTMMLATSFAMQIIMITFVLICLLPFFLPVLSMYYLLVQYVTFAQAYREGREHLALEAPQALSEPTI